MTAATLPAVDVLEDLDEVADLRTYAEVEEEEAANVVPASPMHSPTTHAVEVETEIEDNLDELAATADDLLNEVDEDLEDEVAQDVGSACQSTDYSTTNEQQQMWKNLGCETEAGRMLRRLYAKGGPAEAASKVSYPRLQSPANRWDPKAAARKPCPKRTAVRVPKPCRPAADPDDPRQWRAPPLPGRKPAADILAEMDAERPQIPDLPKGRDQVAEKQALQDRFQFCGGSMMPKAAMGYAPKSAELPKAGPRIADERRQLDENGMNAEQRDIFEELMLAVKRKQQRIKELDEQDAADSKPSKRKSDRNKEALQLQNDIDRCLSDIDKLVQLTC